MTHTGATRAPSEIAREVFRVLFDERDLSDPYHVFRFDPNGKIDTNTVYYDGAEFARQIGMLPRRDSAVDRGMLAAFNAGTRVRPR